MNYEQLKNSILQEAICGRLVPQDPNDEPAAVLLNRIADEKKRLVKAKKIKADKNESHIYRTADGHWMERFADKKRPEACIDDEIPFDIPETWEWTRLKSIVSVLGDGIHGTPEYDDNGEVYFINGNNLNNGKIVIKDDTKRLSVQEAAKHRRELNQNTILVSINGTIGNVAFYNNEPVILGKSACYFNVFTDIYKRYIKVILNSKYFLDYAKEVATGSTIKNVPLAGMRDFFIPLPPLPEQRRIVEKLEQILPKVEKYGKAQDRLDALNIALPEKLKASILQEAIEGRLVPQNPNDEPASAILDKIEKEKTVLVKAKKIKSDKNASRIYRAPDGRWFEHFTTHKVPDLDITDEVSYDVPESWELCRLKDIANLYTGNSISGSEKSTKFTNVQGKDYIGTKDIDFRHTIAYDNGVNIPERYLQNFKIAKEGKVLLCIEGGSAGRKIGILNKEVCFGNKLCCFDTYIDINKYLFYFLQSPSFKQVFNDNKSGIIGGVSINTLKTLIVPIPPINEQRRIVSCLEKMLPKLNLLTQNMNYQ